MIDIGAHCARAAGSPCPHGRRDVVDDRDLGRGLAHAARNAMREIRTIDDYQSIQLSLGHCLGGPANAVEDTRQSLGDRDETHYRNVPEGKQARQPFRRHRCAAHATELHGTPKPRAHCAHEPGAELVSGFFADHDTDAKRPWTPILAAVHQSAPSSGSSCSSPCAGIVNRFVSLARTNATNRATSASPANCSATWSMRSRNTPSPKNSAR